MSLNVTLLLLGLGAGALISLTALGLVVMYRSSGVLNFATGGIGMACSYVFWDLTREAGWSTWAGGAVSVLLGAALGFATYVLVMVLPRRSSNLMRVIATLAVLIILESAVQLRYGPNPLGGRRVPAEWHRRTSEAGSPFPASRLILLGIAVALSLGLAAVYSRTTFGLATTAVSEHPRELAALGWRVGMVGSINWVIGGALAGLAGVLLAPITGVAIGNGHASDRHGVGRGIDRSTAFVSTDARRRSRDRHDAVAVQHSRPRDHRARRRRAVLRDHRGDRRARKHAAPP